MTSPERRPALRAWLAFATGLALAIAGIGWSVVQGAAGAQPWDPELADNVIFARSLPFIIGFGILTGLARALVYRAGTERRSDGAIRRFHPVTALNHWINAGGFLVALLTGSVQYLKGVADFTTPVPLFWVYRIHFIGASMLVFSASLFVTYRLMIADQPLVPGRGQWIRHLRGLAHELPRPLGGWLAALLGLNMRREPPPVEQFTYYEKVVSFPIWAALLGLILLTGIVKAMRYLYPIPGEILWWASALHVAAMVGLAIKFLDHLRYVFAPGRWPLLRSMALTWVSEQYVSLHHPAWRQKIMTDAQQPLPTRSDLPTSEPGARAPGGA